MDFSLITDSSESSYKCLLVDDEPNVIDAYLRHLDDYNVVTAYSGYEALAILAMDTDIAVIVTDMSMPGIDGVELLRRVRLEFPHIILMMLTGELDQEVAQKAINTGGIFRFLRKPCPSEELMCAIDEGLELFKKNQNVEIKRQSLEAEIDLHKYTDAITGLANRSRMEQQLTEALATAHRRRDVMICLDVNHFHLLNELHSFVAGDALLMELAKILQFYSRDNDIIARISKDVFVLYLLNCDIHKANSIISAIRRDIVNLNFSWQGNAFEVTTSIGAIPLDSPSTDANMLMRLIEIATKIAREQGRDNVYISALDDPLLQKKMEEMGYFSHINTLLNQQRMRLYFQTIKALNTEDIGLHFELLLRVLDEHDQPHSPIQMLNAAEKYILSDKIDRWVIRAVAEFFSRNPQVTSNLRLCSINLSGNSLRDMSLTGFIKEVFFEKGLNPNNFCFEITETAAIVNLDNAINFIDALKAEGFKVAIDDFGTGHSSFAYLKYFNFDYLKIDGVFIKDLLEDKVSEAITSSINVLAHALGKKTIAEFVESAATANLLRAIGVDFVQGYYIGKPQPLESLLLPDQAKPPIK
jgi:diguanylate cyclase (GGDEF)-like protein